MSEESAPHTTAEVVESWTVPAGATQAGLIRSNILVAIEQGYDDPQLVADLAVGPLVMALGKLEVGLAEARRRIEELERALAERDARS
ncbi:hypothetical protein [Nocardia bhagyanarayanae]|uniref:Uncharacterized protein n=1 Tax=Nocardia bhagyanarayanae TaxID=1215925 RepID=A0A543F763_9NOCA|nr:hypothetical protein [Nocardia bhagyanarayanae]TQM29672.1 hypothetical protein FB390_1281 [Nocardia bhagyanarayanae]